MQKSQCFSLSLRVRKKAHAPVKGYQAEKFFPTQGVKFLFDSGLQLIEWGPLKGQSALSSLLIQILISANTITDTPRIMFDQITWVPCGPVK